QTAHGLFMDRLAEQFEQMRNNFLVFVVMLFPILTRFPVIGWRGYGQYKANAKFLLDHVREDVRRCMKTYDKNEQPGCFVHAYMQRMDKNALLTEDQMVNVCSDFFIAGMETTSTTLRWAMLHMAANQQVQDKIRAQIHSVLGKDGEVTMADRQRLPYTSAAISELQRVVNILPLNVIHRTLNDTKVDGHVIPNDTLIMPQINNVLKRGEIFDEPGKFKPERFLLADGKTPNKQALEQLIPFSMGKRMCAGEGLARMELFLGLVSILQKYRLLPPKNGPLDLSPIVAVVMLPKTNKLQMVPV
ncbi:hypothetical protein PMAYCL1PPCAC_09137, partial [Pristionchus mayeri]